MSATSEIHKMARVVSVSVAITSTLGMGEVWAVANDLRVKKKKMMSFFFFLSLLHLQKLNQRKSIFFFFSFSPDLHLLLLLTTTIAKSKNKHWMTNIILIPLPGRLIGIYRLLFMNKIYKMITKESRDSLCHVSIYPTSDKKYRSTAARDPAFWCSGCLFC